MGAMRAGHVASFLRGADRTRQPTCDQQPINTLPGGSSTQPATIAVRAPVMAKHFILRAVGVISTGNLHMACGRKRERAQDLPRKCETSNGQLGDPKRFMLREHSRRGNPTAAVFKGATWRYP